MKIIKLDAIDSTNSYLKKLLNKESLDDLTVVVSKHQTQGRGRNGNVWSNKPSLNLAFSIYKRFSDFEIDKKFMLNVISSISVYETLKKYNLLDLTIKWPNDIQIEGRKVAGILTEMSAEIDHVRHVILGIGIDVNQTTSDFTGELSTIATSLKLASGKTIDRARLAERILLELDADYRRILDRQFPTIAEEWAAHCTTIGKEITVDMGPRRVFGRAEALDESGALLVRTQHGRMERVMGGDVTLAK